MKFWTRVLASVFVSGGLVACSFTPTFEPSRTPTKAQATAGLAPTNPLKEHRRGLLDAALEGLMVESGRVHLKQPASDSKMDLSRLAREARRFAVDGYTLEAIALFVDALHLAPEDATLYFDLAKQLEREKRIETAIAVLRTGLDLDAQNPEARHHLAGLLHATERRAEALAELRYLVEIAPSFGDAQAHLALLLHRTGDLEGARHHLGLAEELGTETPAQFRDLLEDGEKSSGEANSSSFLTPMVGPQVRVDNGTDQLNESSAASSSVRPLEVVSAWHSYDETGTIRIATGVSLDEGSTWSQQIVRPPVPFRGDIEGDPMTAVDPRTGTSWAGGITFEGAQSHLFVATRSPGSQSFSTPAMIRTNTELDKAFMAAGPRPGLPQTTRLYAAYTLLSPFRGQLQFSDDLGASWGAVRDLPEMGTGLHPRVGPNGELYILYWDGNLSFPSKIRLARSFNGGITQEKVVTVATRLDWWNVNTTDRFPGTFRAPVLPYLAVNPINGHLYVVYFDTTNTTGGNDNVDLYFTRSTDHGTSWTTPAPILAASPPADQFFPWLEVDSLGRLHLQFWDTRNVAQNDSFSNPNGWLDVYYALSSDEGTTWSEHRLTSNSFNAALAQPFGTSGRFLGDYSSLAVGDEVAHPVYVSTQNGNADLFTHRIEVLQPPDVRNDYYGVYRDSSLDIFFDDLLINDISLAGGSLSVCANTSPQLGTLLPFAGGATYLPPVGYIGTDTIGFTVCDSTGGQADSTLSLEVLADTVTFSDNFDTGIGKGWKRVVGPNSFIITSSAASLQGTQGLEVGVAGSNARAFLEADGSHVDNYRAIFQFDPQGMSPANGDVHTIFRGLDSSNQGLFEVQVDRPTALGPHRLRARLRNSNGLWLQTSWQTVDRPVAVDLDWHAGPSLPFLNAQLRLTIDGQALNPLSTINSNRVSHVRLGITDVIDPQTQGLYRFDSYLASSILVR